RYRRRAGRWNGDHAQTVLQRVWRPGSSPTGKHVDAADLRAAIVRGNSGQASCCLAEILRGPERPPSPSYLQQGMSQVGSVQQAGLPHVSASAAPANRPRAMTHVINMFIYFSFLKIFL